MAPEVETYLRSQDVVTRTIGDETLIVPVRSGVGDLASIYSLNEIGNFIWDALAEPATVEAVVDAVVASYQTTRNQAQRDVEAFLAEMVKAKLAEPMKDERAGEPQMAHAVRADS
jgi:Coenzyme PQQ synthesis protein D (PqqD)